MRICITRESCHQYPWVISSVPVSHILSTGEDMQYLWVISSVPVSHILSTGEDMQYLWVISSVPVSHIISTRESYPQYPWVNLYEWRMNKTSLTGTAYPWKLFVGSLRNNTHVKQDRNTAAYFLGLEISRIYFFGFVKKRFLLFWGTEFLLGLSPLPLLIK